MSGYQPASLGPMHLSNNRHYEVQRLNNFEVVFEGLDDDVTLSVASFSPANSSNSPITLSYGNSDVKVAGKATFSDASLVVNDYIKADMEGKLTAWRDQVFDPKTMKIGWAEDYKRNGRLYQYGPDGTCQRVWRLKGCWPVDLQIGEFNYEGGGAKSITMTISVDVAYPERDN